MNKPTAQYLFFNEMLYQPVVEVAAASGTEVKERVAEAISLSAEIIILSPPATEAEKAMLANLMKAIGRTEAAFQIVSQSLDYKQIMAADTVKHVWLMGDDFTIRRMPHFIEKYHPTEFHTAHFLTTDPLRAIEANQKGEKKQLWAALQQVFGR